MRKNLL